MYPLLHVHLDKIENNARVLIGLCKQHSIQITGVTKCVCGSPEIAGAYVKAGIKMLGDSRVENLKTLAEHGVAAEKWLIRAPMECEIDGVVRWADASVNSELSTIRLLNDRAAHYGRKHKVILMADLGDIREGFVDYDDMLRAAVEAENSMEAGRILDIDVLTADGQLSRLDMGLPPRRCLLCGESAKACARAGTHDPAELRELVIRIIKTAAAGR